jgi:hypothetical protein
MKTGNDGAATAGVLPATNNGNNQDINASQAKVSRV